MVATASKGDVMKKLNTYDILSILVIGVLLVVILSRFDIYPVFVDIYYHMSVALSFGRAGGVVFWDFWEFAPEGRPHLYPPLLHCIMLFLSEFSSDIAVGKFISFVMFPASQVTLWFFSREVYSRKTGFYALLILSSSMEYFRLQAITSAAALVLVLTPLLFYTFEKGKYIASVIILASCLYSHVGMGPVALCSFGVYTILHRERIKEAAKIIAASLVLYSPWGIHVLVNMESLSSGTVTSGYAFLIFPWILGIFGASICIKKKKEFLIPVCILVCMLPIAFTYTGRFTGHSVLPLAMLSGVSLAYLDEKMTGSRKTVFVIGALLVLSLVAPTLAIQPERKGTQPQERGVRLQQGIRPQQGMQPQSPKQQPQPSVKPGRITVKFPSLLVTLPTLRSDSYLTPDNLEMAEIIKRNSQNTEIISTQGGMWGCFVTATTGRPQILGMWHEVASDFEPDPKSASLFVMPRGQRVPEQLVKIGETDKWTVYKAPSKKMIDIPDASIRKGIVYLVLVIALVGLLYDSVRGRVSHR